MMHSALGVMIGVSSTRRAIVLLMDRPVALSLFCKSYAGVFLRR